MKHKLSIRTTSYSYTHLFFYEEYQTNTNVITVIGLHSVACRNCTSYKKSNNVCQLQTTISFVMEHISCDLHNELFNASHASLLFEKHNSIEK